MRSECSSSSHGDAGRTRGPHSKQYMECARHMHPKASRHIGMYAPREWVAWIWAAEACVQLGSRSHSHLAPAVLKELKRVAARPRSGRVDRASKHHRRRLQTCAWDAWQHGQAKKRSRGAIWAHASMHHHAVAIRPGRMDGTISTCRRLQLTRSHSSVPFSRRHPLPRWSGQVLRPQDQHGRRPRSRAERRTAPTSRREVRIFLLTRFRG